MNDSTVATQSANDSSEAKPAHGSPAAQPDHLIVSVLDCIVLSLHCPQFEICFCSADAKTGYRMELNFKCP